MGIESGVEPGLEILYKQMTVEQNLGAVAILKELGIVFSYGFMLFDPSSTFESVRENIGFLREIVGDGTAPRRVLPDAALRRHADPRRAGEGRPAARRPHASGLRFPRPAASTSITGC